MVSTPDEPRGSFLTVAVVGTGTMGTGIAQAVLTAGHVVLIHDMNVDATAAGRARIVAALDRMVEKGRLTADGRASALARLEERHDLRDMAREADLVIEAVVEDLQLKRSIFRALDMEAHPSVALATNTSSLSVGAMADGTHHRERVLGLHFFNPAPVMPLVEVVATDQTLREVIQDAIEFVQGLGKTAVLCADAPGFIVNRVNRGFTLEPLRMLEAGEGSVESIDAALEAAGYPMGPFRLMDLVGIDVNLAVARSLFEGFDEAPRFRPSPIQEQLVAAGTLGRKTGRGFYVYGDSAGDSAGDSTGPRVSAELPGTRAAPVEPLPVATIVERVNLALINEAYRAVEERVASPQDVDTAIKLGVNHPLGPFERAGQLGLRAVVEGLRRQHAAASLSGDQYEVAPLLWQIATA
jgi:3-hydroxybutyryl-CoA dehydrogenase